jgi:hypothetical protein
MNCLTSASFSNARLGVPRLLASAATRMVIVFLGKTKHFYETPYSP